MKTASQCSIFCCSLDPLDEDEWRQRLPLTAGEFDLPEVPLSTTYYRHIFRSASLLFSPSERSRQRAAIRAAEAAEESAPLLNDEI